MSTWNAEEYLKFGNERTRPAADLVGRIDLHEPAKIIDLGCGPGNSTSVLRARWPQSTIIGIDSSEQMIETARTSFPSGGWLLGDAAEWEADEPVDLLYSNAVLQWIPGHGELVQRLFGMVASGGAMAFQIPSSSYPLVREIIHEVSTEGAWALKTEGARGALTMMDPPFYYDALAADARSLDIWETEYYHVMQCCESIVEWIASTGLRPFLAALEDDSERDAFLTEVQRRVADAYQPQVDGKVLFPFRRTFVVAYR